MDLMVALEAYRQEKIYFIQPIPEPSSPMMNLARHLALANLADWIVG
jgi:hypothetical protein